MFRKSLFVIIALVTLIALVSPDIGQSIPAFARKYSLSCSTCHVAAPKLKDYGNEFAGNGFELPDGDEPVRAFRDVGDDNLLLQRELPLAVRFDAFARYVSEGDINGDFQSPFGVKLLSGGNVAPGIGYYFYFFMNEAGEIAGVEDAYIHFNDIKGTALDVLVGQFQICDPLFKREIRLTYEDYEIFKTRVGDSPANLTYDRGIVASYDLPTKTNLMLQVVNGNGIGAAKDDLFDSDNNKNVFFRAAQSFPFGDIGVFGYTGKDEKNTGGTNAFSMFGPTVNLGTPMLELNAQWLRRTDDNPDFLAVKPGDYETDGVVGELIFNPRPDTSRLLGILLYNTITSDYPGLEYETVTANVTYMLKTNFRILGEVTRDIENESTMITTGFMTAF